MERFGEATRRSSRAWGGAIFLILAFAAPGPVGAQEDPSGTYTGEATTRILGRGGVVTQTLTQDEEAIISCSGTSCSFISSYMPALDTFTLEGGGGRWEVTQPPGDGCPGDSAPRTGELTIEGDRVEMVAIDPPFESADCFSAGAEYRFVGVLVAQQEILPIDEVTTTVSSVAPQEEADSVGVPAQAGAPAQGGGSSAAVPIAGALVALSAAVAVALRYRRRRGATAQRPAPGPPSGVEVRPRHDDGHQTIELSAPPVSIGVRARPDDQPTVSLATLSEEPS